MTSFLHRLGVNAGRLVPAVARLHDERNALMKALAERPAAVAVSPNGAELARLRQEAAYIAARRSSGFAVEFDYPYVPRVRDWQRSPLSNRYKTMIAANTQAYAKRLAGFNSYAASFQKIATEGDPDEREPFWNNGWLPPLDAVCLAGLVIERNPRSYVEVGSGNSTKFVRRAIRDFGLRTKIISIDPFPRAVIDDLCDTVVRSSLEDTDLSRFSDLGAEDILFIDNSHRSFQNSDVTVFFTEILPILKSKCMYGVHDIFLPFDYPKEWLARYYNEQYLLMTYLLGGAGGDDICMPVHFVQTTPDLASVVDPIFSGACAGLFRNGGAFWMTKA